MFYHSRAMHCTYTDNFILPEPCPKEIDDVVSKMKQVKLSLTLKGWSCPKETDDVVSKMKQVKLSLTLKGSIGDFLGVNIDRNEYGTINFIQPRPIESILKYLNMLDPNVKTKNILVCPSRILHRHSVSEPFEAF